MLRKLFTDHPETVNETYLQHMASALSFAATMARGALVCGVHAFLPFIFTKSGSAIIDQLHDRMVRTRSR